MKCVCTRQSTTRWGISPQGSTRDIGNGSIPWSSTWHRPQPGKCPSLGSHFWTVSLRRLTVEMNQSRSAGVSIEGSVRSDRKSLSARPACTHSLRTMIRQRVSWNALQHYCTRDCGQPRAARLQRKRPGRSKLGSPPFVTELLIWRPVQAGKHQLLGTSACAQSDRICESVIQWVKTLDRHLTCGTLFHTLNGFPCSERSFLPAGELLAILGRAGEHVFTRQETQSLSRKGILTRFPPSRARSFLMESLQVHIYPDRREMGAGAAHAVATQMRATI